jgi:transcriptional regulator with XRE-family HTH domain
MEEWTLGKKVKEARLHKKLTQREVAGDFITRNMLSKIENDTATPSIKTIEYISQKLDKPVSYFMDYSTFKELDKSRYSIDLTQSYRNFSENKFEECISSIKILLDSKTEINIINIQEVYNLLFLSHFNLAKQSLLDGNFLISKTNYNKCLEINNNNFYKLNELKLEIIKGLIQVSILSNENKNIQKYKKDYIEELSLSNKIFDNESIKLEFLMLDENYSKVISEYSNIDIESKNEILKSRIYFLLGKAYYKNNDLENSLKLLLESKKLIDLNNFNYFKSDLFDLIGKVYSKNKDFEKAYEYAILAKKHQ